MAGRNIGRDALITKKIALWLSNWREKIGLKQDEAGEALEVSKSTYFRLEMGLIPCPFPVLDRAAEMVGKKLSEVFIEIESWPDEGAPERAAIAIVSEEYHKLFSEISRYWTPEYAAQIVDDPERFVLRILRILMMKTPEEQLQFEKGHIDVHLMRDDLSKEERAELFSRTREICKQLIKLYKEKFTQSQA